ncbi:Chromo domain protein Chp1p, partial [Rasamsonia emersonii CBS 393.64]
MEASNSGSIEPDPMDLDPPEGNSAAVTLVRVENDDDDDISLTSTASSEKKSEYEVETVYDETEVEGETRYLVKWAGYPDEECTWEPEYHFNDKVALQNWYAKRRAIERGELPAFKREGWERKRIAYEEAKNERKRRRRAKRIRLGLAPSSGTDDEEFYEENPKPSETGKDRSPAQSDSEGSDEPIFRLARKRPRPSSAQAQPSQPRNQNSRPQDSSNHKEKDLRSPLSKRPQQPAVRQPESATRTDPKSASTIKRPTARRSVSVRPRLPAEKPVSFGTSKGPGQRRDLAYVVFRSRAQRAEGRQAGEMKMWKCMSTVRKYGQAARNEPEPNASQLVLMRPSEWTTLAESQALRRPNWKDTDSLFVEQDDDITQQPPQRHPANSHPSPRRSDVRTGDLASSHEGSASSNPPTPVLEQNARGNASKEGRRVSFPGTTSMPQDSEGWRSAKVVDESGNVIRRHWKRGELLSQVYYGTDKIKVGDVRVCNLPTDSFKEFLKLKAGHRLELWFQELWSIEQYHSVFSGNGNGVVFHAWIERYDDTSAAAEEMAQYLADRDLVAIFQMPKARFAPIVFCYPAKSRSFGFLNGRSNSSQGGSLRLAGWNGAFSVDKFNAARLRQAGSPRDTSAPQRPERQGRFDETVGSGVVGFLASKGSLRIDTSTPNKEPQPPSLQSSDTPTDPKNSYPDRFRPHGQSGAEGPSLNQDPRISSRAQSSNTPTDPKNSYPDRFRPHTQSGSEGPYSNKDPRISSRAQSSDTPTDPNHSYSDRFRPQIQSVVERPAPNKDQQKTSSMIPSTIDPSSVKGLPPRPPSNVHSGDLSSAQDSLPGRKDPSSVEGLPPQPPSMQPNVQPQDLSREKDSTSNKESVPSRKDSSDAERLQPNKELQPISDLP